MSKAGWYTHFREPIPVPKGEPLVTLRDAGAYITKLPKARHDSPAWQNAMHVLIQAADHGGNVEFARMGMMRALYPKGGRKDPHFVETNRAGGAGRGLRGAHRQTLL
jgi:hypothetical protein